MTIAEKILAIKSRKKEVTAGEYVEAQVDLAFMHDGPLARINRKFIEAKIEEGLPYVWDSEKVVVVFDHYVPATSPAVAEDQKVGRELIKKHRIGNFYDVNTGVCHQVLAERGHVRPGMLIVGTDSHMTTLGSLNAASTGLSYTEMAYVLLTGNIFLKVPETIKFNVNGKLRRWVVSKDIMLDLAGKFGTDIAQYKSVEFAGSTVDEMSIAARMTMSNLSIELGAKFGICPADKKLLNYLKPITQQTLSPVAGDEDATYEKEYDIDVTDLEPQVACPHDLANVKSISEAKGIGINQAFLGSCTNGRLEDLEVAARILKGKKVNENVRFIVSPASWSIYRDALKTGIIEVLVDAGAIVCNPTCGPCFGALGSLASGERCISSSPRNFKGRMGSPDAEIYLGSPAVVAASALKGVIQDPRELEV